MESVYQAFTDRGRQLSRMNVYDDAPTAQSFERTFGISYPSILDAERNRVQLAFAGDVPPNGVATTVIMDREGRVTARISGRMLDEESACSGSSVAWLRRHVRVINLVGGTLLTALGALMVSGLWQILISRLAVVIGGFETPL